MISIVMFVFIRKDNGRYFTDFTIEAFKEYLQNIPELQIEEYWITGDVRPGGVRRSG